jgi:hypothetical protein
MSSKAAGNGQEQQAHKKNDKYKAKANKYKLKLKALKVILGQGSTAPVGQLTDPRSAHANRIGHRRSLEAISHVQGELVKHQQLKAELAVVKQEQAAAVGLHEAAQQEIEQLREQIKADKTTIEQQNEQLKKDEALHNSYYEALDAQGLICGVCLESE